MRKCLLFLIGSVIAFLVQMNSDHPNVLASDAPPSDISSPAMAAPNLQTDIIMTGQVFDASVPGRVGISNAQVAVPICAPKRFTAISSSTYSQGLHPNQVFHYGFTNRVYVSHRDSISVTFLDPYTRLPVGGAPVGQLPWGVTYNPYTNRVYGANFWSDTVSVLEGTSGGVVATLSFWNDVPALAAYSNVTDRVYVTGWQTGNLYAKDRSFRIHVINTGSGAFGVAVSNLTGRVYLTNRLTQRFYIVDDRFGQVLQLVTLPSAGYTVGVNEKTNHVFVVGASRDVVYMPDGANGALLQTLPVGRQDADDGGQGIVVNYLNNCVYVANYAAGTLSVIQD